MLGIEEALGSPRAFTTLAASTADLPFPTLHLSCAPARRVERREGAGRASDRARLWATGLPFDRPHESGCRRDHRSCREAVAEFEVRRRTTGATFEPACDVHDQMVIFGGIDRKQRELGHRRCGEGPAKADPRAVIVELENEQFTGAVRVGAFDIGVAKDADRIEAVLGRELNEPTIVGLAVQVLADITMCPCPTACGWASRTPRAPVAGVKSLTSLSNLSHCPCRPTGGRRVRSSFLNSCSSTVKPRGRARPLPSPVYPELH